MLNRSDHDRLVASLHSAMAGETPWALALADFAGHFHSSALAFSVHDSARRVVAARVHGYSPDFVNAFYNSGAYDRDPRVAIFQDLQPGSIYYDHMLYDVDVMERDPRVRETIDALKVKYQLGAMLRLPDRSTATFALLSTPEEGHATPSAILAFRRLAPHIEQACVLGPLFESEAATRTALLRTIADKADGVVLLDSNGAPVFMNSAAEEIIAANDGLCYTAGDFVTRRASETRKLRGLIGGVIAAGTPCGDTAGGHMAIARPSGRRPYLLRALPAPRIERFLTQRSIACILHLQDLARTRTPSRETLCAYFGLTERETDFAIALVLHVDLESAAASAGMAVNTARNHLHGIFRKTATTSQATLIQLLGRLF